MIALIAHDAQKDDILEFVREHLEFLSSKSWSQPATPEKDAEREVGQQMPILARHLDQDSIQTRLEELGEVVGQDNEYMEN